MKYFKEEPLYIKGFKSCLVLDNSDWSCPKCIFHSNRCDLDINIKTQIYYYACIQDVYRYKQIK